jgi:calcineurin-like phosphoesterase family protein
MTTTTTWFTTDWHLGHLRIIDLCDRPFRDLDHMHDEMVRRHNELVAPSDLVFVQGDVVMGKFLENIELVRRFNGRLWLIPGNHDRVSPAYGHSGPAERREAQVRRFAAEYQRVFERILWTDPVWELSNGARVQLSHYPYEAEDERDQRYNELRPRDEGLPLVHGHVHNSWRLHPNGRELNAGVDVWDFRPVREEQVIECLGLG